MVGGFHRVMSRGFRVNSGSVRLVDGFETEQTGRFSGVMMVYWNDNYLLRSGIGSATYTRPRLRCLDVRR